MYGGRARIGCIIPSTNTVVESEFNALKPDGVSVHADRIHMVAVTSEELNKLIQNAPMSANRLASAEVDIIVFACTSGSFFRGSKRESDLVVEMEKASKTKCITTSRAVATALEMLGAKKIAVVTPYTDEINERERNFLEEKGFKVAKIQGMQKIKNTEIGRLKPEDAYDFAMKMQISNVDAVFISCTDFRTIEIIEKLENQLRIPVISSNQASFWLALRSCRINEKIANYGKLLLK
ncbi:MAG: maleate cis-trans isomerase family protein [Sedimentisphaerales bacterium]